MKAKKRLSVVDEGAIAALGEPPRHAPRQLDERGFEKKRVKEVGEYVVAVFRSREFECSVWAWHYPGGKSPLRLEPAQSFRLCEGSLEYADSIYESIVEERDIYRR